MCNEKNYKLRSEYVVVVAACGKVFAVWIFHKFKHAILDTPALEGRLTASHQKSKKNGRPQRNKNTKVPPISSNPGGTPKAG